jgi:hypothetical protein
VFPIIGLFECVLDMPAHVNNDDNNKIRGVLKLNGLANSYIYDFFSLKMIIK